MTIEMIPLNKLRPSKANPRKSFDDESIKGLAKSILADGLLQNLVVAKPETGKRKYDIIGGERRFRAFGVLIEQGHFPKNVPVPCEVREGLSEAQTLRIATMENVQRQNLTPLEEASAIAALVGSGESMADIAAKTGLSETTIKRRIALLELSEQVRDALTAGEITLTQAEAFTVASHDEQAGALGSVINGWYSTPEEIRDHLISDLPTVAMAVFDKKDYGGDFTTDLFGKDETTYFNDAEQFFDLQKQAAQDMAADFDKQNDWAIFTEGRFSSLEYEKAGKGESGGVVVNLTSDGRVEVHKGLIKKQIDESVSDAIRSKPKTSYAKNMTEYFAMHKSAAVQLGLIGNRGKAMEVALAHMLRDLESHRCLSYLAELEEDTPHLAAINKEAAALCQLIGLEGNSYQDLHVYSIEDAYELVQRLDDAGLDRLFCFLSALKFGQTNTDALDTREQSVFNRVALDLVTDMRIYWKPSAWFLSRRTMAQLQAIIMQTGLNRLFGNGSQYKKSDLVRMMGNYFAKLSGFKTLKADQRQAKEWLPEAMSFPAIDPDAIAAAPEEQAEPVTDEQDDLARDDLAIAA